METIYLCIVIFLLCLAVFDLFVGVSNDAVNFLQSAVGARVATFRTVLIIASIAVVLGAVLSSGMMDIARHGIMMPARYSFHEVMTVFLAVMVTDVIILDVFNSLGMPTSTTVSLVFELLGGAFMISTLKIMGDPSLDYGILLNSDKALSVIIAIFVSVAISFVVGMIVMWISRVVFTFNYKKHSRYAIAIFGGISFTVLAYFIFMKGVGNSPYVSESVRDYINSNINLLLIYTFIGSTIVMEVLHLCRVDIFKFVVLMGTFGLAMAFAGNDLVNFIGVPLAGLASYQDYAANAHGAGVDTFMMKSLMESAKTPPFYLMAAGIIMIVAMGTSKKAQNVIKTSVDLARQDEGDEMFGSSKAARAIVRFCQWGVESVAHIFPASLRNWINSRFNANEVELVDDKAAFDVVRAAVNLVIASMLITFGTNHKLPLSTTYVTFMVAMGSSLADRAWSRESAVFRVTGVLSVIGGWFITAGVAFITCSLVALTMWYGGIVLQVGFMILVIYLLWHSNQQYKKKKEQEAKDEDSFRLMMRTRDPELVWDMLQKRVSSTQCNMNHYALDMFNKIMDGFTGQNARELGRCRKSLHKEQDNLKKYRRQEMLGLKKSPQDIAIERNTWFHLGANSDQQFIYCLRRMLEPVREHVDNNFNPIPEEYIHEFQPVRQKVNDLMHMTQEMISNGKYDDYRDILSEADLCRDELSTLRKGLIDHIQQSTGTQMLQVSLVYLNILQETDEFLNIMRHQLRAAKKFIEN
ncbi:inorganic phosphate transporter [Hallella mizrahii]|uniref:Phosphate transporter n=1 Tax=Hallella mizrahii TaxID=2606637 RepID=A0A7K0KFB0_9BACT|nr:inorganic phosphate transporter [Hallella mizrahii]MST84626.1 inorganic phosphate transporter [Hallella mizrahii]